MHDSRGRRCRQPRAERELLIEQPSQVITWIKSTFEVFLQKWHASQAQIYKHIPSFITEFTHRTLDADCSSRHT